MEKAGRTIVIIGICVVAAGIIVWLFGDKLRFLGRLPGDVRYEGSNTRVYFPFTTMLLLSAVLSLILWLVQKLK